MDSWCKGVERTSSNYEIFFSRRKEEVGLLDSYNWRFNGLQLPAIGDGEEPREQSDPVVDALCD